MRYYFTVQNHETFTDDTGYPFNTDGEASDYARIIAGELAQKHELNGSVLIVTDEEGKELQRLKIHSDDEPRPSA